MKRPKFKDKSKKIMPTTPPAVRFEIEDNAFELMEEHLALFKPPVKDADTNIRQEVLKRSIGGSPVEIDLHGLTLEEAERLLTKKLADVSRTREKQTFKIITGKGRHSRAGQGVLIKEIYLFVKYRYGPWIVQIEESPDNVRLGGQAIRGHFHVTLKGS